MDATRRQRLGLMAQAVLVEGGLVVVAGLIGWWLDTPAAAMLHWDGDDLLLGVAATLPMLAGFFAAVRWPVGPLGHIKRFGDEIIRPLFAPCSPAELALVAGLAGLGEELLFRGVLPAQLVRGLGVAAGVVTASVVFGLLHAITPTYAVLAALLGAYLGGWSLATDNLLVPIVAHALYDFVALVYLARTPATPGP